MINLANPKIQKATQNRVHPILSQVAGALWSLLSLLSGMAIVVLLQAVLTSIYF